MINLKDKANKYIVYLMNPDVVEKAATELLREITGSQDCLVNLVNFNDKGSVYFSPSFGDSSESDNFKATNGNGYWDSSDEMLSSKFMGELFGFPNVKITPEYCLMHNDDVYFELWMKPAQVSKKDNEV